MTDITQVSSLIKIRSKIIILKTMTEHLNLGNTLIGLLTQKILRKVKTISKEVPRKLILN